MTKLLKSILKKQIFISKGKGIYLFSKKKKYTDLTSGYTGHAILGWGNRKILNAISKQAKKYCHIDYKTFIDPNREELAREILKNKNNNLDKVFFVGSSGSEACEAALKMSYQYFYNLGYKNKKTFISRRQSYHGSTSDALNLGDRPNLYFYKNILNKNVQKVSEHNKYRHQKVNETDNQYTLRCVKEIEMKILKIGPENVCAFVGETIMGGLVGDVPPNKNYWKLIRKLCNKYNIHLIIDEVWCGTGTSGKNFCIDWDDVTPDFIFLSKTLAAGYGALSAVITKSKIGKILHAKNSQIQYSNTHQGYSLSVAAALEVQKIINNKKFLNDVNLKGEFVRKFVSEKLKNSYFFKNIRGRGLRNSIEYSTPNNTLFGYLIKKEMFDENILIDAKWHRICLPIALNISFIELEKNLNILVNKFQNVENNWPLLSKRRVKIEKFF